MGVFYLHTKTAFDSVSKSAASHAMGLYFLGRFVCPLYSSHFIMLKMLTIEELLSKHRSKIWLASIILVSQSAIGSQIFLGPHNPGAENGPDWYNGVSGGGAVLIDKTDPSSGLNDFTLSNSVPDKTSFADWRSWNFPLKSAESGAEPIAFSFVYKLPNNVIAGNNIRVELRFFDQTGTNYLDEKKVLVGADTSDGDMANYKTIVISNIYAPTGAKTADIRINANLFEPWASGIARFDDFSVTTFSETVWPKVLLTATFSTSLAIVFIVVMVKIRRKSQ